MVPALVVVAAIVLIVLRYDTRLVLLAAGLGLSMLAGRPLLVADTFGRAMVAPMVAPICASMGFAAVLNATACDRHLVRLLLAPVRRAGVLTVPGGIVAAYFVNLAVTSQASVAAMLGPVLLPLLRASGLSPARAAAALVLGASFGGDLLNPAAQDVLALAGVTGVRADSVSARLIPAGLIGLPVAALVFAIDRGWKGRRVPGLPDEVEPQPELDEPIDVVRAFVPLVPVVLLLAAYAGWSPLDWLRRVDTASIPESLAPSMPVVRSLLIGAALASVVGWRDLRSLSGSFFRGMGTGYAEVISLTIVAQCFGAGVAATGLGDSILRLTGGTGPALAAVSVASPWALATLSGSGSGPVLAFAEACLKPLGDRPDLSVLGALSCLGAAFGRTMSPVSAVVICAAGLSGATPISVVRALSPSLVAGAAAAIAAALLA